MKITREVNGVLMEFELDSQELFSAYEEQEHIWDVSYIEGNFGEDERFSCMSDKEREEAYDDIAWDFRKTVDDMEYPEQLDIAHNCINEFFEDYEPKNVWISVYKDALGFSDDFDNLTQILVPIDWLKGVLSEDGVNDLVAWLDEYTADSTDGIARLALEANVILKCSDDEIMNVLHQNKENSSVANILADAAERSDKTDTGITGKNDIVKE